MMDAENLPATFKEMCEYIAAAQFLRKDEHYLTSEEIFNYSPTGELYMLFEWYCIAVKVNEARAKLNATLRTMMAKKGVK